MNIDHDEKLGHLQGRQETYDLADFHAKVRQFRGSENAARILISSPNAKLHSDHNQSHNVDE